MPPTPPLIIWVLIVPAIIALIGLFLPIQRGLGGGRIAGILICAGFAIAYWHTVGKPREAGADVKDWVYYYTIPLAILALADHLFRPATWVRAIFLLLLIRTAVHLVIGKIDARYLIPAEREIYTELICIIGLGWWLSLEYLAERTPGVSVPLVLWLLSAGIAVMLFTFPTNQDGWLAASLAAMSFAAAVVAFFRPRLSLARGGILSIVFLLLALLIHGYFWKAGDTIEPHQSLFLSMIFLSPLLAWCGDLPIIRNMRPSFRLAARLIPVAAVIAIAAGISMHNYNIEQAKHPAGQFEDE